MALGSQAGDYNPITYCRLSPHKLFSSSGRAWGQASLPSETSPLHGYGITEGPRGPGESNSVHLRSKSTETSTSPTISVLTLSNCASHLLNLLDFSQLFDLTLQIDPEMIYMADSLLVRTKFAQQEEGQSQGLWPSLTSPCQTSLQSY